jgi:PPK2 family polyphosphate:nucleotide phosphotransferase
MATPDLAGQFLVKPNKRLHLRDHDSAWTGGKLSKKETVDLMQKNLDGLSEAQDLLWASRRYAILIVLQAMDTAGKDGLVKHVLTGVNPQGCQVSAFKQPTAEELDHDFLWRCNKQLPGRGSIGIFNRSYYEDVLVVRVHPELLEKQNLVKAKAGKTLWKERYNDINQFEKHLVRNGTVILKFFLNISKKEQKNRLLARLEDPAKHWKFSPADLAERVHWDDYMTAYEDALNATSTSAAPWHIIPADHKWVSRWLVSQILAETIQGLSLKLPKLTKQQEIALEAAKKSLEKE